MGTTASHVKEIRIDQNDGAWDRYSGGVANRRSRKNSRASAGSRGLSAVGERFRRSAGSGGGSADRKTQMLRTNLEATEKRAVDAEGRVRQLEREMATLELRNIELGDEVTWLKHQLTGHPEVPVPPRPLAAGSRPGTSGGGEAAAQLSSDDREQLARLQIQSRMYEQEIDKLNVTLRRDTQFLGAQLEETKHEFGLHAGQLQRRLELSEQLCARYEVVIRQNLSESLLAATKRAVENDSAEAGSSQQSHETFFAEKPLTSGLQRELREKTDKVEHLEKTVEARDRDIAHLKEMIKLNEVALNASIASRQQSRAGELKRQKDTVTPQSRAGGARLNNIVHKKNSLSGAQPLKVGRAATGAVEDEIEALLRTPEPTFDMPGRRTAAAAAQQQQQLTPQRQRSPRTPEPTIEQQVLAHSQRLDSAVGSPAPPLLSSDAEESQRSGIRDNMRTVSAAALNAPLMDARAASPEPPPPPRPVERLAQSMPEAALRRIESVGKMQRESLSNVYALSDSFEPIKMVESPRSSQVLSGRPQTADSAASRQNTPKERPPVDAAAAQSMKRGYSAPMLFKPSRSRRRRNDASLRRQARAAAATDESADDEILSLHDGEPGAQVRTSPPLYSRRQSTIVQVSSNAAKPPAVPRRPSDANWAAADDAARAILAELPPVGGGGGGGGARPSTRARARRDAASARSRDSGFLGDSYTSMMVAPGADAAPRPPDSKLDEIPL